MGCNHPGMFTGTAPYKMTHIMFGKTVKMVNNIQFHLRALQWATNIYSCRCSIYQKATVSKV